MRTFMFLVSSSSCLLQYIEARCEVENEYVVGARCSNYIWVINNFIAH